MPTAARPRKMVSSYKEAAERILKEIETDIAEGKYLDIKKYDKVLFEEFASEYIKTHVRLELKSQRNQEYMIRQLSVEFRGKCLHQIDNLAIRQYMARRLKVVRPASVDRELQTIKSMFNRAIEWGMFFGVNPAVGIKNIPLNNSRCRWLTESEQERLLSSCPALTKVVVLIALKTGLRWGEIIRSNGSRRPAAGDTSGAMQVYRDRNGVTRILVPVEIGVKIGIDDQIGRPAVSAAPKEPSPSIQQLRVIEKVDIDQDYSERNGYNPKYLGNGLVVPLPRIAKNPFGKPLFIKGKDAELKYWNYSVVMNQDRKLAFFSAANVDSGKFLGNRDADGDKWFTDNRIDKRYQVGAEFYKKQREFEADRTSNPFDQGHLSKRGDLQWGSDDDEAKRNGDDSFHYTNCAPATLAVQPE